jgi:hypothetical protein
LARTKGDHCQFACKGRKMHHCCSDTTILQNLIQIELSKWLFKQFLAQNNSLVSYSTLPLFMRRICSMMFTSWSVLPIVRSNPFNRYLGKKTFFSFTFIMYSLNQIWLKKWGLCFSGQYLWNFFIFVWYSSELNGL